MFMWKFFFEEINIQTRKKLKKKQKIDKNGQEMNLNLEKLRATVAKNRGERTECRRRWKACDTLFGCFCGNQFMGKWWERWCGLETALISSEKCEKQHWGSGSSVIPCSLWSKAICGFHDVVKAQSSTEHVHFGPHDGIYWNFWETKQKPKWRSDVEEYAESSVQSPSRQEKIETDTSIHKTTWSSGKNRLEWYLTQNGGYLPKTFL